MAPFAVKADAPGLRIILDLVPLNHEPALSLGSYRNRLQAKLAGEELWVDLLAFDFTIPDDFELTGNRISRYQYWQSFPIEAPPEGMP